MNLEDIRERMRGGQPIPPHKINEMLVRLAGEYAYYAGMMEEVLIKKPELWTCIRQSPDVKSDAQANQEWSTTNDGKNEIGYRLRMKAIEKMMSALRSMAETARRELDNAHLHQFPATSTSDLRTDKHGGWASRGGVAREVTLEFDC